MTSSTRHLVDPELLPLLDRLGTPFLDAATLPEARARRVVPPGTKDGRAARTARHQIPGAAGDPDVRVFVSRPEQDSAATRPAILHIHGGGFVMSSAEASLPLARRWAEELDCVVVSVDYRLAPETPFPGPLDDCYAALCWMVAEAVPLGIAPERVGVAGESAGGGLAAGLALLARERGGPALLFQNLQYPMLDDRTVTETTPNPVTGEFVWTRPMNSFGWRSYLGVEPGASGLSPFAAPARAQNLADLPPTYIGVGTLDLFVDEDMAYALRLIRAGVDVELDVFPGVFHAFELSPRTTVSIRSAERRIEAMRRVFDGSSP